MMELFTLRKDVPEVYKAIDPAWMLHCPVEIGTSFIEFLPETYKEGEIYFFKEPYRVNDIYFNTLFSGIYLCKEIDEKDVLVYCFIVKPTDDGIIKWREMAKQMKEKDPELRGVAALFMI